MPLSSPQPPSSSRHEQLVALMALAVRLRRQGVGFVRLQTALQQHLATLPQPLIDQAQIDTIAATVADLPPQIAVQALDALLAQQPIAKPAPLPIHTAETIARDTPASVDWLAEPWAATGALTAFTGRPKIGKTTFLLDLIAAVLTGAGFLGRSTQRTPVIYLTEQQPASFRASLARSALLGNDALSVMFWHEAMALEWPAIIAAAADRCRSCHARILVVDTLSQWAGLRGDMENQAGDAFTALQPLQQLAGQGIAVVFLQHERKSGGDAADAGRGSSAFAGAVDTLVSFRNPPNVTTSSEARAPSDPSAHRNRRMLLALSRFDAVPPELYIERRDGRYAVVGETPDFLAQQARAAFLAALPAAEADAVTVDALLAHTAIARTTARGVVDTMLADGLISRIGSGRRGSPYRYWASNSFLAPIEKGPRQKRIPPPCRVRYHQPGRHPRRQYALLRRRG